MVEKSLLQTLLERGEYDVRSYSGRGMMGRTCLGVDVVRVDPGSFFGDLLVGIHESHVGWTTEQWDDLIKSVRSFRADHLGVGTIYYFPNVEFVEG